MESQIEIVLCIDKNFYIPCLVTMRSILDNTQSKIRFNIIIDEDSNEFRELLKKNKLDECTRIFVFEPPQTLIDNLKKIKNSNYYKMLRDHNKVTFFNYANFSRFYVCEIIKDIDTYIYSDVDVVCLGDILKLYNRYEKYNFSSINSKQNSNKIIRFSHKYMKNKLNLKNRISFQTCLYITNNKYWIENNIVKELENIMLQNISEDKVIYKSGTRVPLNIVFLGICKIIKIRWGYNSYDKEIKNVKIIHFKGKRKPWNKDERTHNCNFFNKMWDKYRNKIIL